MLNIRKIAGDFIKARSALVEQEKMLNLLDEEQFGIIWDRILYYEDKIRQMCNSLGLDPEKSETDPVKAMHEFLRKAKPFG